MVPMLGFNSAKYDLNLLRHQLITTYLREYGGEVKVIKQQSAYSKIDLGGRLRFLDVYKYCSPNTNLDPFMKAEGVVGGKFFFPYEWFESYEKLDHPELPNAECFYSSLVSNTFGGPSIIFTRYHEAGKTRLRELVSQTEPDGAGDHTYCQPVGMSNGGPNYVRAYWDMIRTAFIRGVNPSSYLWGPVCTTKWTRPTQKDGSNRLWPARSSASCK